MIDKAFHHMGSIGFSWVYSSHYKDQFFIRNSFFLFKLTLYFRNVFRDSQERYFKASETGTKSVKMYDVSIFMIELSCFDIIVEFRKGIGRAVCNLKSVLFVFA